MDIFNNRISELEGQILKHTQLYYLGQAEISDAEYDKLEDELRVLSPKNSALSLVGHKLDGSFCSLVYENSQFIFGKNQR